MQLVSVVVPPIVHRPPPAPAELSLTVQLVSVVVAADVVQAAAVEVAELPLTVQLVSVVVPPSLYRPPPLPVVVPPVIVSPEIDAVTPAVDLEHPAQPAAADRHARRRARDRLRPGRVAQLELGAGQGDRLRRAEHRRVKDDRLGPPVRIRLAIAWRRSVWPATGVSVGLFTTIVGSPRAACARRRAGRVGGVVPDDHAGERDSAAGHGERGQQPAVLQRHQRWPHPPPLPARDRPPPASPLIPC